MGVVLKLLELCEQGRESLCIAQGELEKRTIKL